MKKISWILVIVACCWGASNPAWADETEQGSGSGDGAGTSGDGEAKDEEAKSDPWTAPKLPEDKAEPEDQAQVVAPSAYPVAEIDRPLALLPLVLEPQAGIILDFIDLRGVDNQFSAFAAAGFGVIEDLEVGLVFPLMFSPRVRGGDFQLYGIYDLTGALDNLLHLAVRLDLNIPTSDRYSYWGNAHFSTLLHALAKYKIVDMVAVVGDLGLGFGLYPGDDAFLFFFDFGALIQPLDALAFQMTFGTHLFGGNRANGVDGNWTMLPLRLRVQYTLIGDLDFFVETSFLDLNHLGADWFQMLAGAAFRVGF